MGGGPPRCKTRVRDLALAKARCFAIYLPVTGTDSDIPPLMNASFEMDNDEVLRVRLAVLRREHRDLDEAIHVLETSGRGDQLTLRRLKKQKLVLKDQIARLDDILTPDIIA
jgi:hypothetical protein